MKEVRLFSNCVPVRGIRRSVIYDLERNDFHLIPNVLYELLVANDEDQRKLIAEIPANIWNEYYEFLMSKDLIVPGYLKMDFPRLRMDWNYPARIISTFIELNTKTMTSIKLLIDNLVSFGCRHFVLDIQEAISYKNFEAVLINLRDMEIRELRLFVNGAQMNNYFTLERLNNIGLRFKMTRSIIIYNHITKFSKRADNYIFQGYEGELKRIPGAASLFAVNLRLFSESQNFNSYYNRKLIISGDNRIVPFIGAKTFYEIDSDLNEVISDGEFTQLWHITKDEIEVCRDCEFRYMCIDSRVPVKNYDEEPLDSIMYFFNSKCTYNPYEAKWE